jgi:hypothetical protein
MSTGTQLSPRAVSSIHQTGGSLSEIQPKLRQAASNYARH